MTFPDAKSLERRGIEVSRVLSRQAKENPQSAAVHLGDRTLTYTQLDRLVGQCALRLHGMGLARQEICALAFKDQFTLLVTWLGLNRLRVGIVCLPRGEPTKDTDKLLKDCSIKVIVSDQPYSCAGVETVWITLDDIENSPLGNLNNIELTRNRWEHIIVGSGSTGKPKLIAYEFGASMTLVETITWDIEVGEGDRYFSFVNLQYGSPVLYCLMIFVSGASIVIPNYSDADFFLFLERTGVTLIDATVPDAELLCRLARKHGRRLGKLKKLNLSSSVITEDLVERLREGVTNQTAIEYATNECWPVCSTRTADENRPRGSVGTVYSQAAVEIVDQNGHVLPTNQPGIIRMRSIGMFSEYIGEPDVTSKRLRDGWFYPGDTGLLNDDGHLILLGRTDYMMIFNGINIYPAEIETVMAGHPAVNDVAALPLKHKIHQDVPICAIQLHPDHPASEQELLEFGHTKLGAKSAKLVFVVDA
ncbi:MAG: fatty acid--CoA ligase family protein, partial [Sneathiella sp.]